MSKARRWGIVLVAAVACLALIGCGGGGGDGGRVSTLQMDIDELEMLRDELATAKTALERQVETEKTARQTAQTELADEKTARQTAQTELADEKTARQTAQTELADEETARQTAETTLATERTAKVEAEKSVAVLTERASQLTKRLETAEADKTQAQTDLATAQKALNQAQTNLSSERIRRQATEASLATERTEREAAETAETTASTELTEAKRQVTVLTTQVRELTEEVATLKVELVDANTKLAAATTDDDNGGHAGLFGDDDDDDTTTQQPTTTTPPPTGGTNTLAANALSEALLDELKGETYDASNPASFSNTVPATIQSPARGTSTVRITRDSRYTASSFSAPTGQTGRKFTRTSVGKETLVVITDLESTRRVLDHHFQQREGTDDAAKRGTARLVVDTNIPFGASIGNILASDSQIRITGHGFPSTQTKIPQTLKTPTTISGQVYPATSISATTTYSVSGRFECGVVTGCEVRLTPTYADMDGTVTLTGVALGVSDKDGNDASSAVLYFKPTTASIPLDGSLGADIVDAQYMVFGYWLTEPPASTPDPEYSYQVFGNVIGRAGTLEVDDVSASFKGTAVGVYVAQSGTATDLSKRQGEFTAAVNLNVDTATPANLKGNIGTFKTTPLGGSTTPTDRDQWLVDLASVAPGSVGTATIKIPGTTSQGGWRFGLVGNHVGADGADNPSAAVGVFDTRIEDRLHLSGAFGAARE